MSLIDDFKEKFMDVTRNAVKASSDFLEVTKINLSISSDEERIKGIMFEIGKAVYETYNVGKPVEAELSIKCDEIVTLEKSIEEKKQKIAEIKNLKQCTGCSSEIDENAIYCPQCGKKIAE
jgi:Zn finger protein HypA/HybF involved in hydrogenase expression